MIKKILTTNTNFCSYRQLFSDKELEEHIQCSVKRTANNSNKNTNFFDKILNKKVQRTFQIFKKYKPNLNSNKIESHIELAILDKNLVGKISYLNTTPVEIKTEMPGNFKRFFKSLLTAAKAQSKEDSLLQQLYKIKNQEKIIENLQKKRYEEITSEFEKINALLLYFDSKYLEFSEKLLKLNQEKSDIIYQLDKLKSKLKNKNFKLR